MVLGVGVSAATLIATPAAAASIPIIGTMAGYAGAHAGTAVAGKVGAGAIGTAIASKAGAAAGATIGTAAATAGVGAAGAAAATVGTIIGAPLTAACTLLGPLGWLVLGASEDNEGDYKWDCWKQVVHENQSDSKSGKPLAEVLQHPSVVSFTAPDPNNFGSFVITNKWREQFRVDFVMIPNGEIAAHATKL